MIATYRAYKSSAVAIWPCMYVIQYSTVGEERRNQIDRFAVAMNAKELKYIGVVEISPNGSFTFQVLAYEGSENDLTTLSGDSLEVLEILGHMVHVAS